MKISEFLNSLKNGKYDKAFCELYGKEAIDNQKCRYESAVEKFAQVYPQSDEIHIFSAPGRTEIGGNHTDHQHGCILAAAVDVDVIGIASFNDSGVIHVLSEGYKEITINCNSLEKNDADLGSDSLIRGIAAQFAKRGVKTKGFDMYCTSNVLSGSGVSSSAAFETLIGTLIDIYYNAGREGAVEIAKIGQYAEDVYFGKKCGLMDQLVSSVGGFVFVDFKNPQMPIIENCSVDFEDLGYKLFITNTKGSHAGLTDDYVAVRNEMNSVASAFGKETLRMVDSEEFWSNIPKLREKCTDRALLRAMHFMDENLRPEAEFEALKKGDIDGFLKTVRESGKSSEMLLQNIYSTKKPQEQAITLGLAMSRRVLGNEGADRVHGGGFAGTIQAFVPSSKAQEYKAVMDGIFGEGSCCLMKIRPVGGIDFIAFAQEI